MILSIPIIFFIMLFREEVTFQQFSFTIGITLFIVIIFYSIGCSAANMDRRAGIASVKLPTWCRRILFFNQKNPFRKRTVFFQTYVVLGLLIVFGSLLFGLDNDIISAIRRWYPRILLILIVVCDIRHRRATKTTSNSR